MGFRDTITDICSQATMLCNKHDPKVINQFVKTLIDSNKANFPCYTTGVGKSAYVAHKFADTLSSIGMITGFIDPLTAFHGDMAKLLHPEETTLVLFSKSGETKELIDLVHYLYAQGVYFMSILCSKDSTLGRLSYQKIEMPIVSEANVLQHIPMTSNVVMEIVADGIVSEIIERKGVTRAEYALYHPGGNIGKQLAERHANMFDL